jgi:hypothetical protein
MQVERTHSEALVVNSLPDGSRVILDSGNERVFALNATAAAAWDACNVPTTLSDVTESMQRSFDPATTGELAEEALLELQKQNLVKTSGPSSQGTRREFLATLGAIAIPLVVSLSVTEQRAYAKKARSGNNNNNENNDNNNQNNDNGNQNNDNGNKK